MVFVAFLNLVYFIMVLLIAESRSNQWDLGLQKSVCSSRSSATSLDKTGGACGDSKASTDETDVSSASVIVDRTMRVEDDVKQVEVEVKRASSVAISTSSASDTLTLSPTTQTLVKEGQGREGTDSRWRREEKGQVEDREERHKRDISKSASTSKPLDVYAHQGMKVSKSTGVHTIQSSLTPDISPSYLHSTPPSPESLLTRHFTPPSPTSAPSTRTPTCLSTISAPRTHSPTSLSPASPSTTPPAASLLPDSKTGFVPQTQAKARTRRDAGIQHKNLQESMRITDDLSRSSPSEVSSSGMIDTSSSHAHARVQPPTGQGYLHLDVTINVTGVTLAVDGVQVRLNTACNISFTATKQGLRRQQITIHK